MFGLQSRAMWAFLGTAGLCALLCGRAHGKQNTSPVTYHQSFDTFGFLEDDYSAQFDDPPLEQRRLELVSGRFGKALHNANAFVPEDFEKTYMSVRDLDLLLEVICHHRFKYWEKGWQVGGMQPYFWGTGRLTTDGGTVAFWAKGKRAHPGALFFQGSSSFGRLEKYLLGIDLREDNSLEAYLVDGRYQRHAVRTEPIWSPDRFHHVALAWDRAYGLTLYMNGKPAASSWGGDAWWTAQIPGLFHMPMCGFTHDELWIFDRALQPDEIVRLMDLNEPPGKDRPPPPLSPDAAKRLRRAFIGTDTGGLPAVGPGNGKSCTVFREIFPTWAGDGGVKAASVIDGRYEMAWPMGYTSFTNILGDSDYQPHKVDFHLPADSRVNYVTLEGNLSDARLLGGTDGDDLQGSAANLRQLFDVPDDGRFFHGQKIDAARFDRFRIPFLKGFGSPLGYEGGLHLALTGAIRIHEVAFFSVSDEAREDTKVPAHRYVPAGPVPVPKDPRYGYAMRTLNDRRSAATLSLVPDADGPAHRIKIPPFARINLLSPPSRRAETLEAVDISLQLAQATNDDVAIFRLHDPGLPTRIWTSIVFRLDGFEPQGGVLRFRLDPADIRLAPGDRLWLDVALGGGATLNVGNETGSSISMLTAPLDQADPAYGRKALQPALASFAKIYSWYYPWIATRRRTDPHRPVTFGGYYDIATLPKIVTRTEPDHFLARTLTDLCLLDEPVKPDYRIESWETAPRFWPPIPDLEFDEAPEWAVLMRYYLRRYEKIVHWWADRQHPDGQVGGGWNDDVLFASRLTGPFLYTGDRKARRMFNRIFRGVEQTRMFHDGYCNVTPIDQMHVKDLVSNRYEGLLFEPGDPHKMKIAMRTAWRLGKPDRTPINYGDGESFRFDHDLLRWYWGQGPRVPDYSMTREEATEIAGTFAPAMNDVLRFRYTDSGMFTDGFAVPGGSQFKRLIVGGECGPFLENLTLSASWERGGGPDIPKWVQRATDTRLEARLYSFVPEDRDVTLRLYRLKKGNYRITLGDADDPATARHLVSNRQMLRRFSTVTVSVPPRRELVLTIELQDRLPDPGPLPDLAVRPMPREKNILGTEVLNFGAAASGPFSVCLEDASGRKLDSTTVPGLDSAGDFVPRTIQISFVPPPNSRGPYRIVADPDDAVEEIIETNNEVRVKKEE